MLALTAYIEDPKFIKPDNSSDTNYIVRYNYTAPQLPGENLPPLFSGSTNTFTINGGDPLTIASPDEAPLQEPLATTQGVLLAQSICSMYGASLADVMDKVGCFEARMTETQARAMSHNPDVLEVVADSYGDAQGIQNISQSQWGLWGLDRIDQRSWLPKPNQSVAPWGQFSYNSTGYNVNAYVLDSGIWTDHSDFGGRAAFAYNARRGFLGHELLPRGDDNGHGTGMASLIGGNTFGIAKASKLFSVKCLESDGRGTMGDSIRDLDWVAAFGVRPGVVNMSLMFPRRRSTPFGTIILTGPLDYAVRCVVNRGIPVSAAAGNTSSDILSACPASVDVAVTVGASTNVDQRWSGSNFGPQMDVFAPGHEVDVASWFLASNGARLSVFRNTSGTSVSCALAAGVIAQYLQTNPSMSPAQVSSRIVAESSKDVIQNSSTALLVGSPNRLLYSGE